MVLGEAKVGPPPRESPNPHSCPYPGKHKTPLLLLSTGPIFRNFHFAPILKDLSLPMPELVTWPSSSWAWDPNKGEPQAPQRPPTWRLRVFLPWCSARWHLLIAREHTHCPVTSLPAFPGALTVKPEAPWPQGLCVLSQAIRAFSQVSDQAGSEQVSRGQAASPAPEPHPRRPVQQHSRLQR